jgi:cytochrome c oxidase subunit 4
LALTAATVGATHISLEAFHIPNIAVSIFIASIKAVFVLWYFMHLKHEPVFLRWLFVGVIALLAIFIGFTILDVAFR